jgi:metal-sulfur cluster biosynthetic enzyme
MVNGARTLPSGGGMSAHAVSTPLDEAALRHLLNEIVDPCSRAAGAPAGIDEMGMLPVVERRPSAASANKFDVYVRLIVTHPFCMMSNVFVKEIHERLSALPEIDSVRVEFDPGEIWTPALMRPEYAERLTKARAARRAAWSAAKS